MSRHITLKTSLQSFHTPEKKINDLSFLRLLSFVFLGFYVYTFSAPNCALIHNDCYHSCDMIRALVMKEKCHCEWVKMTLNLNTFSTFLSLFPIFFFFFFLVFGCLGKTKTKTKTDESSDNGNNDKNNNKAHNGEVLDLRDLDLSQLRLTKKDLETLSSITPSLSKSLQEQLLAQLPPNQAKKLSRTLSVQNGKGASETSQVYRRSISTNPREVVNRYSRDSITPTNEIFDNLNNNSKNSLRFRRSVSRDDNIDDSVNNNNSRNSESLHHHAREQTLSPTDFRGQYYSSLKSNKTSSNASDIQQICFSPEPEEKPKHKRLSRFMSPESSIGYELYDEPKKIEKTRELESHKILRELCEKSREKSLEKEPIENRISYFLDKYATNEISKHLLNGNFIAPESSQLKTSSRSDTASSSHSHSSVSSTINDKILDELNSISLLNGQLEKYEQKELQNQEKILKKKGTVKKVVKKVKEKTPDNTLDDPRSEDLSVGTTSIKRESKIARPKSFVSKDSTLQPVKSSDRIVDGAIDNSLEINTAKPLSKLTRPKSFPNSKITPPKDIKFPDSLTNILNLPNEPSALPEKISSNSEISRESKDNIIKPSSESEPKKTKKVIKVVKKSSKSVIAATEAESSISESVKAEEKREKSPEKKVGRGLLYTIGQKFEKLRESKTKDKKETDAAAAAATDMKEKKKKIKAMLSEDVDEATRQERKSKIDAMIKNLKDKSLPHNTELTESGLIKRAVSVEEMPNTFNKNTVNKVLGLFKRIEKENLIVDSKVQNTKSTSYLSYSEYDTSGATKERPKSSGFVHKIKKNGSAFEPLNNISESKIPVKYSTTCPDCKDSNEITESRSSNTVNKRHSTEQKTTIEEKERLKNNRKGLMLDFTKFNPIDGDSKATEVKKSSSKHNNYSFPPPLPHTLSQDINQTLLTPTYDSLTNYSSSPYDESSTLLSPSEDIGFDRWSTCSEDDHQQPHPLGTSSLSRLSRSIQNQVDFDESESPESVVDRIRRKSFYSRFNEKKPKRVSNIVGPAAKEYYRERSRPLEYTKSATSIIPDLSGRSSIIDSQHIRSTSSARHASSTSSSAANRSLSQTRTTSKYSSDKPTENLQHSNSYRRLNYESSHMASLPPPHHHHHHHYSPDDVSTRLRNNRSTMYDSSSSSSNTPSLTSLYAKRRSYVSTPSSSSGTTTFTSSKPPPSFVDGYATIGRKMRQYNSRSVSLLDPNIINSTNNYVNDHQRANGYTDMNETYSRFVSRTNNKLPIIRHNACY